MQRICRRPYRESGFTLVELLVVIAIISLLFVLSTINLGHTQSSVNIQTTTGMLVADLKSQQLLAMAGDKGSASTQQLHGVYVQPNQYTLFAGSTFNGSDSNNFVLSAPTNTSFSSTFPGGVVLFNKGTGDLSSFVSGSNTITVTSGTTQRTVTINRLGATTVN